MAKKRLSLYALLHKNSTRPHEPLPQLTKRIFALAFTTDFIVIYPFYVIMFGERGDVSATGVGLLLASWMITSLLAEIPTGVIADKVSKKWSLVLGQALQLVAFAVWLLFPAFTGYLAGFIIWGIAGAFNSGAFQAYLYESLNESNKKAFGKIYSQSNAFTMLAYTLGSLAAFAIGPNYNILLILSVLVTGIAVCIALSLPVLKNSQIQVAPTVKPKALSTVLKAIRSQHNLQYAVFVAVILYSLMATLAEYLPAYYQQVGTPTQWVALLVSAGSASAAALYWWMHHFEAQLAKYTIWIIVIGTVLFALSTQLSTVAAVAGFFLFTRMLRVVSVHNETQIQHLAPQNARATLASLYSFIGKLLAAMMLGLIGLFAVDGNITVPVQWSIIVMVALLTAGCLCWRTDKFIATPNNSASYNK